MKEQNEVVENLEEKTVEAGKDVITEVEELLEIPDTKVDAVEDTLTETEEIVEAAASEVEDEVQEVENDVVSQVENMNKHDAAVLLVDKAKILVNDV